MDLQFYCDSMRHLVCVPYTLENLHQMAQQLGIKRCWFHAAAKYPHYDIPKRRIQEIQAKCQVVSPRDILAIVKGTW
jgi:FMN phosphatase YigB (HAD superfamily)